MPQADEGAAGAQPSTGSAAAVLVGGHVQCALQAGRHGGFWVEAVATCRTSSPTKRMSKFPAERNRESSVPLTQSIQFTKQTAVQETRKWSWTPRKLYWGFCIPPQFYSSVAHHNAGKKSACWGDS